MVLLSYSLQELVLQAYVTVPGSKPIFKAMLRIKLRALHILGKFPTIELYTDSLKSNYFFHFGTRSHVELIGLLLLLLTCWDCRCAPTYPLKNQGFQREDSKVLKTSCVPLLHVSFSAT